MFESLPSDATGLVNRAWPDFEPYYLDLVNRSVSAADVDRFLADWTRLSELVDEAFTRLYVKTTLNTADKEAEARYHAFLEDMYPRVEAADQKLKKKLLESRLTPKNFEVPLKRMAAEAELFAEANLPLLVEERKLCTEYDKIIGAQTISWESKELTISQLRPLLQSTDRSVRERVWRAGATRQLEDRAGIGELWKRFIELRIKFPSNAGLPDYRSYRWKQMLRFDYDPEDCRRFHDAIEGEVVPAAGRVYERRRRLLGVEKLRPWDLDADALGRPPLAPFREVSEFRSVAAEMFHRVDPALGTYFETMIREGLLDLDNRKNKAPGGYCTEFTAIKRPFIFMNAVGIHDDVQTILHEAGHAFHDFERSSLPYYQQRHVEMEFAEVASMAMELLASPYLSRDMGGFYSEEDSARARIEHLEKSIVFWPYMAVVDAFQHWVYENPSDAADPSACDAQWGSLSQRFVPFVDWTGLEDERITGWQRKLHIHTVPFYYVEYGMAQLGAVQVWRNALNDQAAALAAYRQALRLGGTVPLPELYAAAGARFAFDGNTLSTAVSLMEAMIKRLETSRS